MLVTNLNEDGLPELCFIYFQSTVIIIVNVGPYSKLCVIDQPEKSFERLEKDPDVASFVQLQMMELGWWLDVFSRDMNEKTLV